MTHFIATLFLLLLELKSWFFFLSTITVASCHNVISNRDAFYDRAMNDVLFLLGLAKAPWAERVTHFIAAVFLLLLEFKSWLPL